MRGKLFLLGAAAMLCSGECVQLGPAQFGSVKVAAFSSIGEEILSPRIDLVEAGSKESLAGAFRGTTAAMWVKVMPVVGAGGWGAGREDSLAYDSQPVRE